MSRPDRIRMAVVGVRRGGSLIAEAQAVESIELTAVCDIRPEALDVFKERYPDLRYFTGYDELLAADVCVLPYRDGVSFRRGSFMAALAHGLPIISTRPPMPNPKLRDGENILLVPADDARAAADAVETLVAAPNLRARLARGAQELADTFAWERIAAQTAQLYSELVVPVAARPVKGA